MNFRLYRLPYVALAVILHCMMPQEVIEDSFEWCKFRSSYEIKRIDGTYASIVLNFRENLELMMVVWPDWDGNQYPVEELEE
ncbi:hypothetical protein CAEBREN_11840 [Caenorhabditis brenneri]|uniref:Uncharacterized protein n=1 Tax=Caenorhabditis brenneri TaxID=135651 RepID=G0N2T6_CAEBE|nr:hypothetical protein CAEBREN_11840 [Caenorhabditis brenneri]